MDNNNQQLEARVAELEKIIMSLQNSPSIPYNIDKSFVGRGYVKVSKPVIVLVGEDQGSWLNNVITVTADISQPTTFGDSTTRFDITNTSGSIYRYTYDGTGTDPGITSVTIPIASLIDIRCQNFNSLNRGMFFVSSSGVNYFEVTNPSGTAENDKTIGNGTLKGKIINQTSSVDINTTQFPSAFGIIQEGQMAGYWTPLYVPPRQIV